MGKEIYTEVEATRKRRSTRFFMTLDQAADLANQCNEVATQSGIQPLGAEIVFEGNRKRTFDDVTVEMAGAIEKPNKN